MQYTDGVPKQVKDINIGGQSDNPLNVVFEVIDAQDTS